MKRLWELIGVLFVLVGFVTMSYTAQVCNKTDWLCYEGGPSQNLTTYGRLDVSGNLTVLGTVTASSGLTSMSTLGTLALTAQTAAQIYTLVPTTTGQLILVSNPQTFNQGTYGLCISSGIGTGAFIQISSASAITACK